MNKNNRIFATLLFGLLSTLVSAKELQQEPMDMSGERLDAQACRVLVKKGTILPMSKLMKLADHKTTDHILDAFLIRGKTHYIYLIESVGVDGIVRTFYLDATTGERISVKP